MPDNVHKAIEKLLQFTTRPDRTVAVKFDDLQPLLADVAGALDEINQRLKALEKS